MKKYLLSVLAMLFTALLLQLLFETTAQAATETIVPSYNSKTGDQLSTAENFLYSSEDKKNVTINIPAKPNMLIKRVYWDYGSGTRDVPGNWQGKASYSGSDTISGTEIMVQTPDLARVNTIYYWDRGSMSSTWRSYGENVVYPTSVGCPPAPKDKDNEWKLSSYPNCDDNRLPLNMTHTGQYTIGGIGTAPKINDTAIVKASVHPVSVKSDTKYLVENSTHGGRGLPDTSTQYVSFEVINERSIHIKYRQHFGNESYENGYYKDWAAPGARQMWYYGSFTFKLKAKTYRYKDKQLIVEWMPKENELTTLNVRHMVRTGPTGSFAKAAESVTPFAEALPFTRMVNAETTHGTVVGRNVSYSGYSNTVQAGNSISVNFSSTQKEAYVTFFYEKPAPAFTGDFDIIPDTINYRESFSFKPKNFVMNGCTYQSHRYKIERGGTFTTSPILGGVGTTTSYNYGDYPWIIGVGGHTVSINIKTSCGETGWINHKSLTVNDMAGNNPPRFQIGFVYQNIQTKPVYEVVEGTVLNLVYIDDPSVPTPTDPDGDSLHFMGFDTENGSPFIQSLPQKYSEYTNGYHNVVMDTLGYHHVKAQMRDQWGLASTASTYIHVVPKNPIAIALCPPTVKSGRNVASNLFDASRSYSPLGRVIDHAKNEWTNKKTVYTNDTDLNIIETVQLHVYDSGGLKSLDPGVCQLIVEPDLPPVAKLEAPSLAIRNQEIDIYNRSYSPDNDKIVSAEYKYKYDAANDGFENDNWQNISGNAVLSFKFKPSKVGKYLFYTKVTEDYGKTDDTLDEEIQLLTMDVINDAPTISFDLEGNNAQPALDPHKPYLPQDILKDWKLYQVNSTNSVWGEEIKWYADGKTLTGGTGKLAGKQQYQAQYRDNVMRYYSWADPFQDVGLGNNNLSPYRAMQTFESAKMQPLLLPYPDRLEPIRFSGWNAPHKMRIYSNESHFYFAEPARESTDTYYSNRGTRFYAANKSKIGRYKGTSHTTNGYDLKYTHEWLDGSPYDFTLGPQNIRTLGPAPKFKAYRYHDYNRDVNRATFLGEREYNETNISGYYVTDKTIYQMVGWNCGWQCSYYNDNGDYRYDTNTAGDIRAYDAFTGEFLFSTLNNKMFSNAQNRYTDFSLFQTHGDNLLITTNGKIVEMNRKGEILKEKPSFYRPSYTELKPGTGYNRTCRVDYSSDNAEDFEAWYFKEITYCTDQSESYSYVKELYLIKVSKKDLNVVWRTKLNGTKFDMQGIYVFEVGDPSDGYSTMIMNPKKNELLISTFDPDGFSAKIYYQRINTKTGVLSTWNIDTNGYFGSTNTGFEMDWNGNYTKLSNYTRYPNVLTAEGWKTQLSFGNDVYIRDQAGNTRNTFKSSAIYWLNFMYVGTTETPKFGTYVGDGMFLSFSNTTNANGSDFAPLLHIGQPTTDPLVYDAFTLGQFVSDKKLTNAELIYSMTMHQPSLNTDLAGMSFRMSDPRNRYAVENDGKTAYLSKYVNGVRTVLNSKPFIAQQGKSFDVRIQFVGESLKVWINNVPFFDLDDSTYEDGFFGMYSDKGLVDFGNIGSKDLQAQEQWSTQYAIWEEDEAAAAIRTDNVLFDDPEKDPIAELGWSLFHTVRFINNQGLSDFHNKPIGDGDLLLDKVGDYKIALKGRDDPHPNYLMPEMAFDEYRKDSNEFVRNITVHRRPIADFDVVQRASDGMILWTDRSHDPDRYESGTHYSDEVTGIDYRATKGVMEKRFYYITPSKEYVAEKLVSPQEVGQYEIGLAVKDEYGAWSTWAVRTLDIGKIAVPNTPPVPGFTKSHTTTYRGVSVTINSTARDQEDGGRENLAHAYYVRNKTENSGETIRSNSRTSWTTTFNKLGTYTVRQLVEDSAGANAQTQQEIVIVNRKPAANITVPSSTNQNAPTKLTVFRPEFRWTYSDADSDKQNQFQVRIYRYGGYLVHESDVMSGAEVAWKPGVDLPEKTNMYVQVRVHDGFEWGARSAVRYFYIETNQPPSADFTWLPQPVHEGDTVAFRSVASDPDRDALNVVYLLTDPDGVPATYTYSLTPNASGVYPSTAPNVRMLKKGNWTMRMTVSDGKAPAVVTSKTVAVRPLGVTGFVKHTPVWNEYRQDYNLEKSGNAESPRGYEVFWAGEKFVLEADTTWTGTSTIADRVEVSMSANDAVLEAVNINRSSWIGEMWEESFEQLGNGKLTFTFTAFYSNGIVREDEVEVQISGNIYSYFGVHRVK